MKLLKKIEFFFPHIVNCINKAVISCGSRDPLKLFTTVSVYKRKGPADKESYRPVSILPLLSKVYEKVLYGQFCKYMNTVTYELLLCGFRKAHLTKHVLFRLIES